MDIPTDISHLYEDSNSPPEEWDEYDFDSDEAAEFLFYEQIPKIHDNISTLREQKD